MSNYLYNGIALPPLPEWDKTAYPYVHIKDFRNNTSVLQRGWDFGLYTTNKPLVCSSDGMLIANDGSVFDYSLYKKFLDTPDEWKINGVPLDSSAKLGYAEDVAWANHDILNEDGTVYLAASCPIDAETGKEIHDYCLHPVTQINPSELMQGFATMLSLRRNRT